MVNQPTISVLVITYNHEFYIRQTLQTILAQKGNFLMELVISNDCSTDGTHVCIEQFLKEYRGSAVIRYTKQEKNLGILPNFIFALQQCTGDYLAICEGDDYWLCENKLQMQLDHYRTHPDCSMVITNRQVIRENGSDYTEAYDQFYGKKIFTTHDIVKGFIPGTQTIFVNNDPDLPDYLTTNRDLQHADRYLAYFFSRKGQIYLLPHSTAAYRLTGSGAWSSNNGIRKLQVKAEQLADFHRRIGLPESNEILAEIHLACWFATLKYCLKRPYEFTKWENRQWITGRWPKFSERKRLKRLLKTILHR